MACKICTSTYTQHGPNPLSYVNVGMCCHPGPMVTCDGLLRTVVACNCPKQWTSRVLIVMLPSGGGGGGLIPRISPGTAGHMS